MSQANLIENPTLQQIPLNKLVVAPENSRKTNVTARQKELKASLEAYGLLHPLLVRPADKKGQYYVVDGQRRLLALKALVKDKVLKSTYLVKCEEVDPNIAQELSLTANVQAQTMHPADQFEAFFAMSQNNISVGDIAARFGVSEKTVKQRLKLAQVSPKLLELYRKGEMSLEHLEAFTLSDDHEKQETVWAQLQSWQKHAHHIKAMLTEQKISSKDKRIKFITLEAYEKAGGHFEPDLFSEDIYLTDIDLVESLVTDKMIEAAKAVEAEGWSFVEVSTKHESEFINQHNRIWPEPVPLSEKDAARLEIIEGEIKHLEEIYGNAENQDELDQKLDALEARQEQLVEKMEAFTPEQKAKAGAYVSYHHGDISITRGLIEKQALTIDHKKEPKPKKVISDKLLERLTAHKTLALQDALTNSPQIAFDLMLAELVKETFRAYLGRSASCFHFNMQSASFPRDDENLKNSIASVNREKTLEKWAAILKPNDETSPYDVVSSMKTDQKMQLLAFCFAGSLDAIQHPKEYISKGQKDMINGLADLLQLDMTQYWKPNASLYFNHIAKDNILNVIREVKGLAVADSLKKLKKGDLALAAEKRLKDSNWLPEPLRIGVHKPDLV